MQIVRRERPRVAFTILGCVVVEEEDPDLWDLVERAQGGDAAAVRRLGLEIRAALARRIGLAAAAVAYQVICPDEKGADRLNIDDRPRAADLAGEDGRGGNSTEGGS